MKITRIEESADDIYRITVEVVWYEAQALRLGSCEIKQEQPTVSR